MTHRAHEHLSAERATHESSAGIRIVVT